MGIVHSLDIPLDTIVKAIMKKDQYMHYYEVDACLRDQFGNRINDEDMVVGLLEVEISDKN